MKYQAVTHGDRCSKLILFLVLGIALFLRTTALNWGLPNALHPDYSYHPDEAYFLDWAHAMAEGYWFPKLFQYGGTGFYSLLSWVDAAGRWYTDSYGGLPVRNTILLGRIANIIISLATVVATYRLACVFCSREIALTASMLLAVLPAHVFWAVRVRPDELFTLLVVLNLLAAAGIWSGKEGQPRVLVAGLLLGATIAIRFPGALLTFPYAFALFRGNRPQVWKAMGTGSLAALAGYFLLSPGTLLHPDLWLVGMRMQWGYQTSGPVGSWMGLPAAVQYPTRILSEATGLPAYMMMVASTALMVRRGLPAASLLLPFLIPYVLLLASASWIMVRYTIPVLPLLCIWTAAGLATVWQTSRAVTAFMFVLVMATTLSLDMSYAQASREPDPRDIAAHWIQRHVPDRARLAGFIGYRGDLFSIPPPRHGQPWTYFVIQGSNINAFLDRDFDYVVIHSQWLDQLSGPPAKQALGRWLRQQRDYYLVALFERPPRLFGLSLGWAFSSSDYRLALPAIYILRHRQPQT